MFRRWLLLMAAWLLLPAAASASPITYTYSGFGTGALANSNFTNAGFVITAQADTDDIALWGNATVQNTHSSAQIQIDGLGTFAFTIATHTWMADFCCMGFGRDLSLNLLTLFAPAIVSVGYDLDAAFAPTLDPQASTQGQFNNVATTGGNLSINSVSRVTFAATTGAVVPEPNSLAVVLLGLGLVGWTRRNAAVR